MPLSGAHSAVRLGDCDTREGMPMDVRLCVVLQWNKMPLDVRFVLCRKGRNAVGIRQW